ncbi:MAG: bifunctional metallophosphatase/5'-nucleotidase [Burkholderiaceae bacterium]|nr:bifunctional metallophosphatase/5'-nucleotidase [Burkholderiaceae bacterium]
MSLLGYLLAAALALSATASAASAAGAEAASLAVRIIAINDFHGHLEPGDNTIQIAHPADPARLIPLRSGGAAHLAARVRALRADVPHSVFVAAGDLVGASPLVSALFRDEPTIEVMNLMGLELNAVGNHEFDHGTEELTRLIDGGCASAPRGEVDTCANPAGRYAGATFPFIAANVLQASGEPWLPPAWVRTIDGVKLGFIGAVTRSTPGIVMPTGIRDLRFLPEAEAINRQVKALRAQGVHALVAVVHEGGDAEGGVNACENPSGPIFDIVRALDPAVSVVVSAHTHRGYNCLIDGRIVIQGASFGRLVSVVDLQIDRGSGEVLRDRTRALNLPVPNGSDAALDPLVRRAHPPLAADPDIDALVAHYRARAAPLASRPVARLAATFDRRPSDGGDHAAGRLIADAHLAATRAAGAHIAFTNPGGVRGDLSARPPHGDVTFGDVFTLQPFGNSLVTLTLSGAQLKQLLESQWSRRGDRARFLQPSRGFSYAWTDDRPWGERVDPASLRLDGARIDPQGRYRVTVNSFLAAGGDGFALLRNADERVGGPLDVDALASYLRAAGRAGPVAPDPVARIRRIRPGP